MRTIEYGTTTHVPAFLTKLWKLVTDVSCDDLISWSLAGTSFIIYDEIRFSKELLPMYFKHNNMASFVRQLNMYGFRKLSCVDQGGMHCYKSEIEFFHQYFLKGQESLLDLIKRKIPNSKSEEPKVKQEYLEELISSIRTLKGKQDSAEQNVKVLRKENKILWRHIEALTDRYTKQQTVIQQLLPFFMNMVRSSREIAMKRKAPLMIDEGETHNKVSRLSPQYFVQTDDQDSNHTMPTSPGNVSNRGPVIHDVTEMESSKMYPASILCPPNTTTSKECEVIVDSPLSSSLESSEQTIDSPFTEPASMETLNILNQNYERRSRSNSFNHQMEMKHSPVSVSSSSMGMGSPPSMSSYPSTSNGISPTIHIDETTSDVPLSNGLLRSPFVPKIEDTCTDSGFYTMNSMMNEKVSSIINEETMSILTEGASSMTSAQINGGPSSMTSPQINRGASSMTSPHINRGASSMTPSQISRVASSMTSPQINRGASSMTPPQINRGASTSSGNKFTPNAFLQNIKNDPSEINWMMNQPAPSYTSETSFENWLGQLIKSDNLTPGCSLPQAQGTAVNGNYV